VACGRGLSGVFRDKEAINVEHVAAVIQVYHVGLVIVPCFRDDEVRHVAHERIRAILSPRAQRQLRVRYTASGKNGYGYAGSPHMQLDNLPIPLPTIQSSLYCAAAA